MDYHSKSEGLGGLMIICIGVFRLPLNEDDDKG